MKVDLWDSVILLGFAVLLGGLWWIMPPLSLIVAGVLLMLAGLAGVRTAKPKPAPEDPGAQRV